MSILSFTDKKISLILVTWILFSSLFSLPIKGITGNRILGSSMYFIFEILLLTFLLIRNSITKNIRISNFDIPFLLYLFYGIFQLMWSYLNNNGLYQIIYDYRRFYFSVLFYLVIRQYLTYYLLTNRRNFQDCQYQQKLQLFCFGIHRYFVACSWNKRFLFSCFY